MCRVWFFFRVWLWDLVDFWFASLPWKRALTGLPFLLVLVFLVCSFFFVRGEDFGLRQYLLGRQLAAATATEDWETARLVLNRQLQAAPDDRDAKYQMAKVLDAMNERDQAVELMRSLTFVGSRVDVNGARHGEKPEVFDEGRNWRRFGGADLRACRWMVEHVYHPSAESVLTDGDQQDFLDLLKWMYECTPDEVSLRQLYAEQLLKAERYREALPVLVALIPEAPGIGLRAGIIARMLGDERGAHNYARRSLQQFAALVRQEPSDAALAVALARCQVFLGEHSEAAQTIQSSLRRCNEEDLQVLRRALGEALVAWAVALERKAEQTVEERVRILDILQVALQHAPNNEQVLQMVVNQVLAAAAEEDLEIASLRESLTHGVSPGISHFIRGTAAVMKRDYDEGRLHLEVAAKTLPGSHVILNNLAYVMSQQQSPDLGAALQLSETAISQVATPTPYHLETRGQILFKMGRYVDAIADLEAALPVPELATAAHRSLAECYRKLGTDELSQLHRSAAESSGSLAAESSRSVPLRP